jgi:hypothetical protein
MGNNKPLGVVGLIGAYDEVMAVCKGDCFYGRKGRRPRLVYSFRRRRTAVERVGTVETAEYFWGFGATSLKRGVNERRELDRL